MINSLSINDKKKFYYNPRLISYTGEGKTKRGLSIDYVFKNKALERTYGVKTRDELDKIALEASPKDIEYPRNTNNVKFDRFKEASGLLMIYGIVAAVFSLLCAPFFIFDKTWSIKDLFRKNSLKNFGFLTIPFFIINDYAAKALPRTEFNKYGKRENTGTSNLLIEMGREIIKDITNPFR